jgi:hypothetical protein
VRHHTPLATQVLPCCLLLLLLLQPEWLCPPRQSKTSG